MAQDERLKLAKILRNGTATLSLLFGTFAVAAGYAASRSPEQLAKSPAWIQSMPRNRDYSGALILAAFAVSPCIMAVTAHREIKKMSP